VAVEGVTSKVFFYFNLGVNTRHRHYSTSFIMVSQGYKEIPKTIRTNWTALIVFEIGNEKEVFVVLETANIDIRGICNVAQHEGLDGSL
jgi:hypothetical protein